MCWRAQAYTSSMEKDGLAQCDRADGMSEGLAVLVQRIGASLLHACRPCCACSTNWCVPFAATPFVTNWCVPFVAVFPKRGHCHANIASA